MEKRLPGLDLDALRSFVTGMGAAASPRRRSVWRAPPPPSAPSSKSWRVSAAPRWWLNRGGTALTAEGEKLMSYARRLLALNDETLRAAGRTAHWRNSPWHAGRFWRIANAGDPWAVYPPPSAGAHRRRVDRNGPLRRALAEQTLDLALLWQTEDQGPGLGRCPLAWIAHPDFDVRARLASGEPLPLVMFDSPCLMRSRAIACLDAAGIHGRWCSSATA